MPKFGGCLIQLAPIQRDTAFRDIQVSVLLAVVGSGQFAALLQLRRGLILSPCPRQSQSKLIVSPGTLGLKSYRFSKLPNGFLHLPVAEKCLAQIEVRRREGWLGHDHFAQLLDFFGRPVARILAVGHGQIKLRFQQSRRERYGLAELQYGLSTVSGNEGCAKIRMRVSKIGSDAQSLTKLGDSRLVLVALC